MNPIVAESLPVISLVMVGFFLKTLGLSGLVMEQCSLG